LNSPRKWKFSIWISLFPLQQFYQKILPHWAQTRLFSTCNLLLALFLCHRLVSSFSMTLIETERCCLLSQDFLFPSIQPYFFQSTWILFQGPLHIFPILYMYTWFVHKEWRRGDCMPWELQVT
jgi:hypothetical protein